MHLMRTGYGIKSFTHVHGLFNLAYATDLTDAQWGIVCKYIPAPKHGGRPRTTNERRVVDAIFYFLKTGCQWRQLPSDLPHWRTVYGYFIQWRKNLVWKKMHHALYAEARKLAERQPKPTALIVDSQSVKTGKLARKASRGFDGGKKIKGRKRHIVTDTLGLLVDVSVAPANVHDTKGARYALNKIAKRWKKKAKRIQTVFADKGYQGPTFAGWVQAKFGATVQVTENLTKKMGKFIPAKKRWVVERGFAWLGDYRRLDKDHERHMANSMTLIRLAFIRIMLRRLCPS
jgi:putative transposase